MTALQLTSDWPVPNVAAAILQSGEIVSTVGDLGRVYSLASLTKPLSSWAALIAVEEGIISLDSPVGQPGCTLRHLLAHAGGYGFDGKTAIAAPQRTRGYSNAGFEILGEAIADASEIGFNEYVREAVLEPLAMGNSTLLGSPAHAARSTVGDFVTFVNEVSRPVLVTRETAADAVRAHYPQLGGIVPGVGRYDKCPWGLGFEVRGEKSPHWTSSRNSEATFGHFGGAGTMFWVEPELDVAVVAFTDRDFGAWSLAAWPELSNAVLTEFGGSSKRNQYPS